MPDGDTGVPESCGPHSRHSYIEIHILASLESNLAPVCGLLTVDSGLRNPGCRTLDVEFWLWNHAEILAVETLFASATQR